MRVYSPSVTRHWIKGCQKALEINNLIFWSIYYYRCLRDGQLESNPNTNLSLSLFQRGFYLSASFSCLRCGTSDHFRKACSFNLTAGSMCILLITDLFKMPFVAASLHAVLSAAFCSSKPLEHLACQMINLPTKTVWLLNDYELYPGSASHFGFENQQC